MAFGSNGFKTDSMYSGGDFSGGYSGYAPRPRGISNRFTNGSFNTGFNSQFMDNVLGGAKGGANMFDFGFGNGKPGSGNLPSLGGPSVQVPYAIKPPIVPKGNFDLSSWFSKNKDLISGTFGALQSIGSTVLGYKNYGLAKDQFNFQKEAFNKNYANQVITTNNDLYEQARRRRLADPTAETPEQYLAKHGVK